MSVYAELEAAVLPLLTHHHDDLLKHDREFLEKYPGKPFLHWTWPMGTYLIIFQDAADYPKKDERVPYLFGTADRWHIVKQVTEMADHFLKPHHGPHRHVVHHFDGRRFRQITLEQAVQIARDYRKQVESTFVGRQLAVA